MLKRRLITTDSIKQGKIPYCNVRIWRLILAGYIRESGVSVRTRYSQNPGHWESGPNVIRILPYQTEKQLFTSLLPAFSHQLLHYRTGRAKSGPFDRVTVHADEATVFSYVIARCLGLESLFRVRVISENPFRGSGMSEQSKQQIREAAFELLTNLWSRYDHMSGISQPKTSDSNNSRVAGDV